MIMIMNETGPAARPCLSRLEIRADGTRATDDFHHFKSHEIMGGFSLEDISSLPEVRTARSLSQAAKQQLCLDLYVISRGGRPGMMVDYAFKLNLQTLLQILSGATRVTQLRYVVLSWGGSCFLVCCREEIESHLRSIAEGTKKQMLIEFRSGTPRWMTQAAETLMPFLAPLIEAIAPSDVSSHQEATSISVIKLEELKTLLMPTLNGILLGYPSIYYVTTMEESQKAARDLSSEGMTVFRVSSGEMIISSFSVPSRLIPPMEEGDDPFWACIAHWSERLMQAEGESRFEQKEVGFVTVSL